MCIRYDCNKKFIKDIQKRIDEFEKWGKDNLDKIKLPN